MKSILTTLLKHFLFFLQYIVYEIKYYLIGGQAIIDDLLNGKNNVCEIEDRSGQIAVVTGGARGIGSVLVKKLLQCNMHVIICCRDVSRGSQLIEKCRKNGIKNGFGYVYHLDLTSLKSVRECAAKISQDFIHLNILVNNAGIMFPPYSETKEGFESQWGVNYIGHFYLTHLLLPLLEKGGSDTSGRIVNITSCAHSVVNSIPFDNINMKNYFITSKAYAQSKLAQILFTIHLDKLLRKNNSNVHVFSVHPGVVNTDIFNGTILKIIFPWVLHYICKSADGGATTVLYPCISSKLEGKGGLYLSNCCITSPSKLTEDPNLQNMLFNYTMKVLSIDNFGKV
ncbi:dehydrogenase/reductase SDR family member on chromosome X [Halyomorpha halys]|uniref:dehydrogenase/reductase SDR family member on chromosome X n=1 Tax=Halyomorpha halys TaxID=286706 RepID=UPI0006D4D3E1|nr:dehydrogenase/reductase SDR family member on chromosome X-like [Halyomorpha halys]XP_014277052.1 dehydrogenase/reductase SDR family member on chromosome X-like [Halyomorpha halys]